jgi:hypothetical protein
MLKKPLKPTTRFILLMCRISKEMDRLNVLLEGESQETKQKAIRVVNAMNTKGGSDV